MRNTIDSKVKSPIFIFFEETDRTIGYNTCQVAKYDNYELGSFSEEAKHAWRNAHWEEDLQKAYDAGRRTAEQ